MLQCIIADEIENIQIEIEFNLFDGMMRYSNPIGSAGDLERNQLAEVR